MPRIAVLPDGRRLEFEDGTPDDVMDRVVQQELGTGAPATHEPTGFMAGLGRGATGLVESARAVMEGVDPTETMGAGGAKIAANLRNGLKDGNESEGANARAMHEVDGRRTI